MSIIKGCGLKKDDGDLLGYIQIEIKQHKLRKFHNMVGIQ